MTDSHRGASHPLYSYTSTLVVLLIVIWGACPASADAQFYNVLHVEGNVRLFSSDESLRVGDQVYAQDSLVFSSATDRVIGIHPTDGRAIFQPEVQQVRQGSSEIIAIARNVLVGSLAPMELSTRSGGAISADALEAHFQGMTVHLLGAVEVPSTCCALTDSSFFFIRYVWKDQEINKKLPISAASAWIIADSLYRVDGESIRPEEARDAELVYYRENKSYPIVRLSLDITGEDDLRQEVSLYYQQLRTSGPSVSDDTALQEITAHFRDTRRIVPESALRRWIEAL